jgi:hypothetical protein
MAIEYKNSVLEITSTGSDQVIYTCPTSTGLINYSAIIKTFTVLNTTGGAGTLDVQLTDTSASATHAIRHFDTTAYATKTTVNVTSNGPIVLESADILKINTSVQPANAFVSVMEISDDLRGV